LVSAGVRLDLYIAAFGWTRMRLAAFLWMGLVALGLLLAGAGAGGFVSTARLVRVCALAALVLLYAHAVADTDGFIAERNVGLALAEPAGSNTLDIHYLCRLGPAVLPALARYQLVRPRSQGDRSCTDRLRAELDGNQADWRSWTWRGHRVQTRLALVSPPSTADQPEVP
ncbi:MAG: DUF4153 domain-containing protein, partial [Pseudomonadota bacterium]